MNCESGVFSVMATPYWPTCLTEAMFVAGRYRPMMSMTGFCLPAVRLYTTSAAVSGWPSDHLTPLRMFSVSVLLPLLHFQLWASHGYWWPPPAEVETISGS